MADLTEFLPLALLFFWMIRIRFTGSGEGADPNIAESH